MRERLTIIGNGLAGTRALEELLKLVPAKYDIRVFGAERFAPYDRIQLSSVLAGTKTVEEVTLHDEDWYTEQGVEFHRGTRITAVDPLARRLTSAQGQEYKYDRLLLCTGSRPFMLPLPGAQLEGVLGFRDIDDVEKMMAAARTRRHAVIIGGGLLGLEAAHGLLERGMEVTVVHLLDTLMERQLDETASELLRDALTKRNFSFRMETRTEAILGDTRVTGLRFEGGEEIPADLLVMAVGIVPNKELGELMGVECGRGICVDDHMRTSDANIWALGECAEHEGKTYGLVAPLYDMAKVWAKEMAGGSESPYVGSSPCTGLKVAGIDVYSGGVFDPAPGDETITTEDRGRSVYKKLVLREDRLIGLVLYGDTGDAHWYASMMRSRTDVSAFRDDLIFGQSFFESAGNSASPVASVSAWADDAEVCGCNGVCKGSIVNAIRGKSLKTLNEVRAHTKASASCGSCTPLVTQLMEDTLGEAFEVDERATPICGCTTIDHDTVRKAIFELELKTVEEAIERLGWDNSEGCAKCRPALNYYLLCAWPGEYVDEGRDRFVNERVHGNIQRDGSFSVIPRIFGGVATPDQLRAIADAADKYGVKEVKITGGQRMGLYGIAKHDLPELWSDLGQAGLVSGHAYGKALRTVKTCVGSEWCRFGVQDSTGLGRKLEQMTWGSWMPHKFKMAVSGCPRNCAEATIKDFGVVCVDSGYEIQVAGNGGMHVRVTDLLTKVEREEDVLEYAAAYVQLYRETASYGVRTAPWLEERGLDWLKKELVDDDENRAALARRFLASQEAGQHDPWAARAPDKPLARRYKALPVLDNRGVA